MGDNEENTIVGFIKTYSDFQREIGRLEGMSMVLPDDQSDALWCVAQNISGLVDELFWIPTDRDEDDDEVDDDV